MSAPEISAMQPTQRYGLAARALHWASAALVFALIGLGLYMTQDGLPLIERFELYQLHKSIGVTLLLVVAIRLAVRAVSPPPPMPLHMAAWERRAAATAHFALYALILAMTLSGWAMVSVATGLTAVPTVLYGVAPWPHIPFLEELPQADKQALEPVFKTIHAASAWSLTGLVALHIAAALRHGLILKDGVMSRMFSAVALVMAGMIALAAASPAAAFEWDVNTEKSRIGFQGSAGGETVKGVFTRYKAEIRFDEQALDDTEILVSIDMTSADTGVPAVNQALPGADFFDAAKFPVATFKAKGLKQTGDNAYEAVGQMTLKGVTKTVTLPFMLTIDRGDATAEGSITLKRSEFGVGPAALPGNIPFADDIAINLNIVALRLDN